MAYKIEFTLEAKRHLDAFTARDRAILLDAIEEQQAHQPTVATRNRKPLRSNLLLIGSFVWDNTESSTQLGKNKCWHRYRCERTQHAQLPQGRVHKAYFPNFPPHKRFPA
jgi:hypothetical protein